MKFYPVLLATLIFILLTSTVNATDYSTRYEGDGTVPIHKLGDNPWFLAMLNLPDKSRQEVYIAGSNNIAEFELVVDESDLWQDTSIVQYFTSDVRVIYGGTIIGETTYQQNKAVIDARIKDLNDEQETKAYTILSENPFATWCDTNDLSVLDKGILVLSSAGVSYKTLVPAEKIVLNKAHLGVRVTKDAAGRLHNAYTGQFLKADEAAALSRYGLGSKLIVAGTFVVNTQIAGITANLITDGISRVCPAKSKRQGMEEFSYIADGASYSYMQRQAEWKTLQKTPYAQRFGVLIPPVAGEYRVIAYFCEAQDFKPLISHGVTWFTKTNCLAVNLPIKVVMPGDCGIELPPNGYRVTWDDYCWTYGVDTKNRPFACDYTQDKCVDPCSGWSSQIPNEVCLAAADLVNDPKELKQLYSLKTNLVVSDTCTSTSECKRYTQTQIEDVQGLTSTEKDFLAKNFEPFADGSHCGVNSTNKLLITYNAQHPERKIGMCVPGVTSRAECYETLGDPRKINWVDEQGGYHAAVDWVVNKDDKCVWTECFGGVTGVNCGVPYTINGVTVSKDGFCNSINVVTNGPCTQFSRDNCAGYCEVKIPSAWGCTTHQECTDSCDEGYVSRCRKNSQGLGECDSCTKEENVYICHSNVECYWGKAGSLAACEGYSCVDGGCEIIQGRTCTDSLDCIIPSDGKIKLYALQDCVDGCCVNSQKTPPKDDEDYSIVGVVRCESNFQSTNCFLGAYGLYLMVSLALLLVVAFIVRTSKKRRLI